MSVNFNVVNEHKLLEYLLFHCNAQKDVNPLAHKLINTFGSFSNVLEASFNELLKVDGVGEITACFLHSLLPIYNFYKDQKANSKVKISTSKDYANYFSERLKTESSEKLLLILLNDKYEVIKNMII